MPVFVVTAPDGKKYKVTAPEGATQDEVMARVKAAHSEPKAPEPSMWERLGNAAEAVGGTILKGAGAVPDMLAEGGHAISKGIGEAAAAGGSAILDAAGRPDLGNKLGKMLTADVPLKTVSQRVDETLPAAREENLAPGVNFAGQMIGAAALDPFATAMPKAPKSVLASTAPKAVQSAGRDIIEQGEKNNVRVFTTDVKPPATAAGKALKQVMPEKIPIVGMAGSRAAQQGERVAAIKQLLTDFGGETDPDLSVGGGAILEDLAKSLDKTRSARLSSLTGAKDAIIKGIGGAVPTPNASKAIDEQIAKLRGINADKFAPVINELKGFEQVLESGKSLDQIEGNRKLLGDLFKDPNLASISGDGQKAINAIYDPLRQDMAEFIKANAGDATAAKWAQINKQLSAMAGELQATGFKRALQSSEITPEKVGDLLFSRKPSDVARLVSNLDAAGKAKAKTALLQRAFDKSIGTNDGLSVERFIANLKTMGNATGMGDNIGLTFSPEEHARIKGLVKLLDATRRAAESMANPPTGNRNMLGVVGIWLGQAMGFTGAVGTLGVGGLLARLYEAPATRNLLVGFSKTQPGSKAEAAMFKKLIEAGSIVAANTKALNDNVAVVPAAARQEQEQQQAQ